MTPPRDNIAGLIERLRDRTSLYAFKQLTFKHSYDYEAGRALLDEAATQLDSLLKEREALQARVKELEEVEIDARLAMLDVARLQQERDEAYERAAGVADSFSIGNDDEYDQSDIGSVTCARSIAAAIRRLAGPEKA